MSNINESPAKVASIEHEDHCVPAGQGVVETARLLRSVVDAPSLELSA